MCMIKLIKNVVVFGVGVISGVLAIGTLMAYVDDNYNDIVYEDDKIKVNAISYVAHVLQDDFQIAFVHHKNK